MLRLHRPNSPRPFQILAIAAMVIAIAPTVQAAPKMAQRVAMQDQPLCFVQLPGKTKNLDKLCGIGNKGKTADRNGVINLNIDVNRDGISDQLLEATQENLDAQDAAQKQYRVDSQRNPNLGTDAINALSDKIGNDLNVRLPYSSKVKELMAEARQIGEQRTKAQIAKCGFQGCNTDGYEAYSAKVGKIEAAYNRDPSFIKVENAQRKVYKEIERRGSAPWLYGKNS